MMQGNTYKLSFCNYIDKKKLNRKKKMKNKMKFALFD